MFERRVMWRFCCLLLFVLPLQAWPWSSRSKFVDMYMRPTEARTGGTVESGYLFIEVDSNLEAMSSNPRYKKFDKGFKFLAVSAEVALPDGLTPEFPLALYDLEKSSKSDLASFNITKGQYIALNSAFQPVVTLRLRAIPKSISTAYEAAVNQFSEVVKVIPVKQIAERTPQLALATKVISAFSEGAMRDAGKEWKTTHSIGLRGGVDAALPLNKPVFVFIVPTGDKDPQTLGDRTFTLCAATRKICENGREFVELPYLIVEARTTDHRPISDWAGVSPDCSRTRADVVALSEAIRTGAMTAQQRDAERRRLILLETVVELRELVPQPAIDDVADLVYRLSRSPRPDDAYWEKHYEPTADQLRQCAREITDQSLALANVWKPLERSIATANEWREKSAAIDGEERREYLEEALREIIRPIETFDLADGDTYTYLVRQRSDIERWLEPYARATLERVRSAPAQERVAMRGDVNQALAGTECLRCQTLLREAAAEIVSADLRQSNQLLAVERLKRAQLQDELATKVREVTMLASTNDALENRLRASIVASEDVLTAGVASREALESAITRIQAEIEVARDAVAIESSATTERPPE